MSVRYQIAKRLVKLTGMKKLFQLPQDELLKKAEQMNRKRQFRMPKATKARYVWLPDYPLCIGHSMLEATQMAYETYRQMLSEYEAAHIAILGFSSGAGLSAGRS